MKFFHGADIRYQILTKLDRPDGGDDTCGFWAQSPPSSDGAWCMYYTKIHHMPLALASPALMRSPLTVLVKSLAR